ncbi:MAG: MBL fold metallo-hydrolase [Thermoanaerobaculia bacterium]|nr:MBL fold metallo-hydrolase [Thermoanaerobaculia bacterium]
MNIFSKFALSATTALCLASTLFADPVIRDCLLPIETSQRSGVELLRNVLETHTAHDSLGQYDDTFTFRMKGTLFQKSQSRTTQPPYDPFPLEEEVVLKEDGRELAVDQAFHWPNFVSRYRLVATEQEAFDLNMSSNAILEPYRTREERLLPRLIPLPALLVARVLESPDTVRLLGSASEDDWRFDVVEGTVEGQRLRLYVDDQSRLRRVHRLVHRRLTGDSVETTELVGEQIIRGMRVPEQIRRRVDGELTAELRLEPLDIDGPDRFALPADFERPEERQDELEIEKLAQGVWIVGNIGGSDYNSLVVEQNGTLVLLETPLNEEAMEDVLTLLQKKLPELPVRTAMVTHHHYDHAGGVRAFMKRGGRLFVPQGAGKFFETIATAPHTLRPGIEEVDVENLVIEEVEGSVQLRSDQGPDIILFDVGENAHSKSILFAWIPAYDLLFQGDLFVKRGEMVEPAREQGAVFLERIDELDLEPNRIVGVHGEIATMKDLRRAVALRTEREEVAQ